MSSFGRIRKLLFGISLEETTFARRGFRPPDAQVQPHLERVGRTFVQGYHAALEVTAAEPLGRRLNEVEPMWRGFAYEGAAMGLALLDALAPFGRSRWEALLAGPGGAHVYMVHVGVGWAAARIPWLRNKIGVRRVRQDRLLRWLVLDGYGFHEGFFHAPERLDRYTVPRQLSGYARRAFDQGLGRSLWFADGADASRIAARIDGFPPERRADLYGGVGLACAYAGGVDRAEVEALMTVAGDFRWHVAQGAAFAAKARQLAGNLVPHTQLACEVLCGMSAEEAAAVTDKCLADLPRNEAEPEPAYEHWRKRIQACLAPQKVVSGDR